MLRAPLLLLGLLIAIARAQEPEPEYIMGFFTDSRCTTGAASGIPAPVPYTTGVCESIPGSPLGDHFNVSGSVGAGFAFNTECDAACSACQQVNIDPNACTPLPGSNFFVQWFQVDNIELYLRSYLDPKCRTKTPVKNRIRISTGNCTDTGNDLTGHSIWTKTSTNELIIATKCDSQCERCAAIYKNKIAVSTVSSVLLVVALALFAM